VWRFPYIVSKNGGAAFILLYLLFLVIFGLPIMTMEFSVGRASGKSIADSFRVLEPKGSKWHWFGWVGMLGNYLLMMFYTTVSGWMFIYLIKMIRGDFVNQTPENVYSQFDAVTGNPLLLTCFMVIVTCLGFFIELSSLLF
jgi:NSS family neurotransmitter:Na+ symporter